MSVARGAALRRPRTIMVMTERSAPSDWEARPSILAQLRAWSAKHPLRPEDGSPPALCDPDEIPIVWARRHDAWNCPLLGRPSSEPVADVAAAAIKAALTAVEDPGAADDPVLAERSRMLLRTAVIETYPWRFRPLLTRLAERDEPVRGRAAGHLDWLVRHTDRGEVIELLIDVLSRAKTPSAGESLRVLARHPWLYSEATWALGRRGESDLDLIWARLHHAGCCTRRRLLRAVASRFDGRPDIRDWVLRHGHSSWPGDPDVRERVRASNGRISDTPFTPCVAAACAVAGDLAGALASPDVGDELLDAACAIVSDLFADMGEDDIETCPDGVLIIDRLIGQLLDRCDTLARLLCVKKIHDWLEWPPESVQPDYLAWLRATPDEEWHARRARAWTPREALGWAEEVRAYLAHDCQRILRRPHWSDRIRAAFATYVPYRSDDPARRRDANLALAVAPAVGVDLLEDGLRMLERYPLDRHLTACLVQTRDAGRVERVIRLAERVLPRAMREATGSGDAGPAGAAVGRPVVGPLTFLLQAMRQHQVFSERLIALALRYQGRERRSAASLLEGRPTCEWGEEVVAALRLAVADEPKEELRTRLQALVACRE